METKKESQITRVTNGHVSSAYSTIRYGLLRATPYSLRCKLYCRGAKCKYCTWKLWSPDQQAIHGLYSTWITERILAMSRPTVKTFTDDNLIVQFCKFNIRAVINLQMLGEHESCGPKLLPSGFTYNPEILMQNGIQFYNFIWPDFGAPGIDMLLDVVKVVHYALGQGKVAVHCHAGLGRTGVVIAAYLIWYKQYTYVEAINYIRAARPNSVQSKKQIKLLENFWKFLEKNGTALPPPGKKYLSDYLQMQAKVLCNRQARKYHHIPKMLHELMVELLLIVHGELGGMTRIWVANILSCSFLYERDFLEKCPTRLPVPSKIKSQEIEICINGVLENRTESFDSADMIAKRNTLKINCCKKFIRSNLRGNMLLLLKTMDDLMDSFRKPIITKQQFIENPERSNEHKDWQCLHQYILKTMAALGNANYRTIAMLIIRWYLGNSVKNDSDYGDIIAFMQNCLERS